MINYFGTEIYKKLSIIEVKKEYLKQKQFSLTNLYLAYVTEDLIKNRIKDLTLLEKQGVIFIGEKLWLQSYLSTNEFARYDQWVQQTLSQLSVKELSFDDYSEFPWLPKKSWNFSIKSSHILTDKNPILFPKNWVGDYLEFQVYGDSNGPSPVHMVKVYEYLTLFESIMASVFLVSSQQYLDNCEVTGLQVTHPSNPDYWGVDLTSEYGVDFDVFFSVYQQFGGDKELHKLFGMQIPKANKSLKRTKNSWFLLLRRLF